MMDPTAYANPNNRAEAERSIAVAAKLLAARDLVGCKRFAELALDADPRLSDERADQILAIADVLLASQKRVNNHYDWYSILQLPHPASSSDSSLPSPDYSLKRHYRRLALLLHPDRNRSPGADSAFRLIVEAYTVLSDPIKRSLFDAELNVSANLSSSAVADSSEPSFWTLCPSCNNVHQYSRAHLNKTLRCQTCRRDFAAAELQSPPPIVPGTDMYYASWGFFPIGIASSVGPDWKPFVPMNPPSQAQPGNGNGTPKPQQGPGTGRNKKKTARKKVMSGLKNRTFGVVDFGDEDVDDVVEEKEEEVMRGININEAAKGPDDGGVPDDYEMIIDLDTTEDMLGNLHNLPFEGINMHMPMPFGRG